MPLTASSLPVSLFRRFFLFSLSKTLTSVNLHSRRPLSLPTFPTLCLRPNLKHLPSKPKSTNHRPMPSSSPFSTSPNPNSTRSLKRLKRESPEFLLKRELDQCSKRGDLPAALRLYDAARAASVPLSVHHYNVLLYLSASASDPATDRGFEIFRQMSLDKVEPNEATFTSAARLAAAKNDPALAFDLIKQMSDSGIPPKLRSYGPPLFAFCKNGDGEKAHEVEAHMNANGVSPEEPELAALLKVNADLGRGDDVYRMLHLIRASVRKVSESTAEIVEGWFGSEFAEEVGTEEWDEGKVKEGVVRGGGGWHGQGWLGKGRWSVGRSEMDESGVCQRCGERLVCIDIDPKETAGFAESLASLACQREVKADFVRFQEWLDRHGPFDAVVDGANVGLYNQQKFSFYQLNNVVNGLRQLSPSKKWPLVILHSRRVKGWPADNPNNKKLLESWTRSGTLYPTPPGSNDDWYWLYAAVSCRSLLVTNDEMRDHLFELLGSSFFPRWKEKHQVRLTFSRHGSNFHMPPPYSIVIQESEGGCWHVPTVLGDDIEAPRQWLCATRDAAAVSSPSRVQLAQMNI